MESQIQWSYVHYYRHLCCRDAHYSSSNFTAVTCSYGFIIVLALGVCVMSTKGQWSRLAVAAAMQVGGDLAPC